MTEVTRGQELAEAYHGGPYLIGSQAEKLAIRIDAAIREAEADAYLKGVAIGGDTAADYWRPLRDEAERQLAALKDQVREWRLAFTAYFHDMQQPPGIRDALDGLRATEAALATTPEGEAQSTATVLERAEFVRRMNEVNEQLARLRGAVTTLKQKATAIAAEYHGAYDAVEEDSTPEVLTARMLALQNARQAMETFMADELLAAMPGMGERVPGHCHDPISCDCGQAPTETCAAQETPSVLQAEARAIVQEGVLDRGNWDAAYDRLAQFVSDAAFSAPGSQEPQPFHGQDSPWYLGTGEGGPAELDAFPTPCEVCGGEGYTTRATEDRDMGMTMDTVWCDACNRSGIAPASAAADAVFNEEPGAREGAHSCSAEIRKFGGEGWSTSRDRRKGETWTCSCGKTYVHICDEAEGCTWLLTPASAAADGAEGA